MSLFNPKIIKECGTEIFSHYYGSRLIDNARDNSDYDILTIHKTEVSLGLFDCSNITYFENIENKETKDIHSLSFIDLLSVLMEDIENSPPHSSILIKVVNHLYAMKYDLLLDIYDEDIFNFYKNWLKSPGNARHFWLNKIRNHFWSALSTLPTKDFNWSQKFNGSDEHIKAKAVWEELRWVRYPIVDKQLGYDPIAAKAILQTLLIAKCVLSKNTQISTDEKIFLQQLKNNQISFKEYSFFKEKIWKEFRLATESLHFEYFLGEGFTITDARAKKVFASKGLNNLLSMTFEKNNSVEAEYNNDNYWKNVGRIK